MKKKKRKTVMLNLKVSEDFERKLKTSSAVLDVPYSQIIREAVSEKLDALAQTNPKLREALEAA